MRRTRRFLSRRREPLQFGQCLVQLLCLIFGCAFETGRARHRAALRIDCDFKVRANERVGHVSVLDSQLDVRIEFLVENST